MKVQGKLLKKGIGILLSATMTLAGFSFTGAGSLVATADESGETPSVTAFATPDQMMDSNNFALHSDTGSGDAKKVYFGSSNGTPLEWYIAGYDKVQTSKKNIVLFSAQSLGLSQFKADKSGNNYNGSDLAEKIKTYEHDGENSKFTSAEDGLMLETVLENDAPADAVKLYVPNGVWYEESITVGADESLRIGTMFWEIETQLRPPSFWLRAPYDDNYNYALFAANEAFVYNTSVGTESEIVPAFDLDLSSVLFASTASASASNAVLGDVMTLRVDAESGYSSQISSTVTYTSEKVDVSVNSNDISQASSDSSNGGLYLYVQGKNGGNDWVYSKQITSIDGNTVTVTADDIKSEKGLSSDVELSNCKIWLETTDSLDNLTYAKMAKEKSKLLSITAPDSITVANGTAKTALALGLPTKVTISTEDASITKADVNWDLDNLAEGTNYDSEKLTEQTFKVKGTVILPDTIDANEISLITEITVTVKAGEICVAPAPGVTAESDVTGNNFVLSENGVLELGTATAGADIYYTLTTDGTEPENPTTASTKYESAIPLKGTAGETVIYKIKAIAVKDGMLSSSVTELTYTIKLPTDYTLKDTGDTGIKVSDITIADKISIDKTSNGKTIDVETLVTPDTGDRVDFVKCLFLLIASVVGIMIDVVFVKKKITEK